MLLATRIIFLISFVLECFTITLSYIIARVFKKRWLNTIHVIGLIYVISLAGLFFTATNSPIYLYFAVAILIIQVIGDIGGLLGVIFKGIAKFINDITDALK